MTGFRVSEKATNQICFRGLILDRLPRGGDAAGKVRNRPIGETRETKRIYFEGFDPGSE